MYYKLEPKTDPQHPDAPPKWYAVPVQGEKSTTEEVNRQIAARSTISPADTEGVLESLVELFPELLSRAPVQLRGIGTFRLGISSKGVENPNDFNRSDIIGNHILYTPDVRILNALASIHYEDSGQRGAESLTVNWLFDMLSNTANEAVTPGGSVCLYGLKMKIEGDDPSVGLKLLHTESQQETAIPLNSIPVNKSKELVFVVPLNLQPGHYQVRITTQFSGATNRQAKVPRTFTYEPLLALAGTQQPDTNNPPPDFE